MRLIGGESMARESSVVSMVHLRVPNGLPSWLHEVLAYMAQHCDDATLAGVAHVFGRHPNTVATAIRRKLRTTFADLLLEMRMQRAASLLAYGVALHCAAACCGYRDLASFGRAFQRRFGMPPAQWAPRVGGCASADGVACVWDDAIECDVYGERVVA